MSEGYDRHTTIAIKVLTVPVPGYTILILAKIRVRYDRQSASRNYMQLGKERLRIRLYEQDYGNRTIWGGRVVLCPECANAQRMG